MTDFLTDEQMAAAETRQKAKAAPDFIPDHEMEKLSPTLPPPKTFLGDMNDPKGIPQAIVRGAAQGSTLGFADELTAGVGGLKDYVAGKLGLRGDISLPDAYHAWRTTIRNADAAAEKAHPAIYTGSQIGGAVGSAFLPGVGALNIGKGAKAAEVLGKSAAMGAATGAGGAENITDVPWDSAKGAVLGAATGGTLNLLGKGVSYAAGKAGPLVAKVLGGVDESNLSKYVAGKDRINALAALPDDAVKDAIDTGVARVTGDRDALASRAAQLEEVLNHGYAQKQAELAGAVTPLAKAQEMAGSLAAQKAYLGSLSEQADDALVRSGASFKKADLLRSIDKIGTGKGVAIGDEAHAALAKLQSTRDRIAEQLPDEIPATQMRDVLQQLRRDVSFDQGAGEFNDTLNGMRKEFTGQISNALKKESPEYAHYMSRMSDLADNLGTMNRHFGDQSKALGSLETLRRGGPRAQLIEDALKNHATINGDQSMLESLAELRQNQSLLSRIKDGEDLRPHLFPKAWNALQEAQAEAQMGQSVADPIERLGQNRTQAIIRNQGGKIPNIEDRRALEALSQTDGFNYPQLIEDRNVADAFKRGQTNGSRMAVMGGTTGGAAGYFLGGAPGAAIGTSLGSLAGGTLDKFGPAIVKGSIDSTVGLKTWLSNTEGVKRLGPYAAQLMEAASKGNETLAAVNRTLLASDPYYRQIFKTDPNQQKPDAFQRRLGE